MDTYIDGTSARVGDVVRVGVSGKGTVVACIASGQFSPTHPAAEWAYLGNGLLVVTDFAGLVHYPEDKLESLQLLRRTDA
jgi:hypothetical protein